VIRCQREASGKHLSQPPIMHDAGLLSNSLLRASVAACDDVRRSA
jgi:hypothetical protein